MNTKYIKFVQELEMQLKDWKEGFSNIVFLCVGTSSIVGDAIGPMVGTKLKTIENDYLQVYGTLSENLNFNNAVEIIKNIYASYEKPYLITVDAALSKHKKIGDIIIESGYIKLGKALEKNICFYSNANIKCVVGRYYNEKSENLKELYNLKLEESFKMANTVSQGIKNVLKKSNIYV